MRERETERQRHRQRQRDTDRLTTKIERRGMNKSYPIVDQDIVCEVDKFLQH